MHSRLPELCGDIIGGCEETTTGVIRLKARKGRKIKFPMIAVNDAHCKYLFDNRYGTGQSVWTALCTTNLIVAGKMLL